MSTANTPVRESPLPPSDRSLVRRLRAGSDDAATQLYLRYARRLLQLAKARCSADLTRRLDPEDIVGATWQPGCSVPTPCVDRCAPTACGFANSLLVSLLQDDGSGVEEDAGGFVVAHEVGHQFGLCHCDYDSGEPNLMVPKCQADLAGIQCTAPLCAPQSCSLTVLTQAQKDRITSVATDL